MPILTGVVGLYPACPLLGTTTCQMKEACWPNALSRHAPARLKRNSPVKAGPFDMVSGASAPLNHLPAVARQQGDGMGLGVRLHGAAPMIEG